MLLSYIKLGHSQGACFATLLNALITRPELATLLLDNNDNNNNDNDNNNDNNNNDNDNNDNNNDNNNNDNIKLPNPLATIFMSGFIPRFHHHYYYDYYYHLMLTSLFLLLL